MLCSFDFLLSLAFVSDVADVVLGKVPAVERSWIRVGPLLRFVMGGAAGREVAVDSGGMGEAETLPLARPTD